MSRPTGRALIAAAAVAIGCAATVPAHAGSASDASALVLSGPGGVQATFVLAEQRKLRENPLTLTGGRGYVAVDLRHSDGRHGASAAVVRTFGPEHAAPVLPGGDDTMPKGRYTLTLIADGPATVTVHFADGTATESLRPTRNVPAQLRTGTAALTPTTGAASVVLPGAVPAGRSAFLVHYLSSSVRVGQREQCATTARSCSGPPTALDYAAGPVDNRVLRQVRPDAAPRNAVTAVDGVRDAGDVLRAAAISWG